MLYLTFFNVFFSDNTSQAPIIELYEFKKLHPDIDILASLKRSGVSDYFKKFISEELKAISEKDLDSKTQKDLDSKTQLSQTSKTTSNMQDNIQGNKKNSPVVLKSNIIDEKNISKPVVDAMVDPVKARMASLKSRFSRPPGLQKPVSPVMKSSIEDMQVGLDAMRAKLNHLKKAKLGNSSIFTSEDPTPNPNESSENAKPKISTANTSISDLRARLAHITKRKNEAQK